MAVEKTGCASCETALDLLVVEDEPSVRRLVLHHLKKLGCSVTSVSSAEEALARLETALPDVMLLDVMLPGIDGIELLRRLQPDIAAMPVIVLSAHGDLRTAREAFRLGAFEFLQKPVGLKTFTEAIESARREVDVIRKRCANLENRPKRQR